MFQKKPFLFICCVLILLSAAAACSSGRTAPAPPARVYEKPYDEVWGAVIRLVLQDLGCIDRKMIKKKGYLETEWVHSFETEGLTRWKIDARLIQRKNEVTVTFNKILQMRDPVSKTIRKYNSEEKNEPVGPHKGWSTTTTTIREIEELYRRLDLILGE